LTRRKQAERFIALGHQIQSLRDRMSAALLAMDYEQALALQIEFDSLELEARQLLEYQGAHEPRLAR
jgi:hypothetical protein